MVFCIPDDQIKELIYTEFDLAKNQHFSTSSSLQEKDITRELFEQIAKQGFIKVRVDGEIRDLDYGMKVDRYKPTILRLVDRIAVKQDEDTDNPKPIKQSKLPCASW